MIHNQFSLNYSRPNYYALVSRLCILLLGENKIHPIKHTSICVLDLKGASRRTSSIFVVRMVSAPLHITH